MNDRKTKATKPLLILGIALVGLWSQCDDETAYYPAVSYGMPQAGGVFQAPMLGGGNALPGWEHRVGSSGIGGTGRFEDFYFIDRNGTSY